MRCKTKMMVGGAPLIVGVIHCSRVLYHRTCKIGEEAGLPLVAKGKTCVSQGRPLDKTSVGNAPSGPSNGAPSARPFRHSSCGASHWETVGNAPSVPVRVLVGASPFGASSVGFSS